MHEGLFDQLNRICTCNTKTLQQKEKIVYTVYFYAVDLLFKSFSSNKKINILETEIY